MAKQQLTHFCYLALLVTLTITGCSPATPPSTTPSPSLKLVHHTSPDFYGPEPLVPEASLSSDQTGCVFITITGKRFTPIWPSGYVAQGDSTSFEIRDSYGKTILQSTKDIVIGGAPVNPEQVTITDEDTDCVNYPLFLITGEPSNL